MDNLSGENLHVFLIALAMVAGSAWMLFFRARVPIPEGLPRGVTRTLLELVNAWLRLFGGWAGCFFLPIGVVLAAAVLEGGLNPYHWPIALILFAVLAVWRNR